MAERAMENPATINPAVDDRARSRQSSVVEVVEREASPVASAMHLGKDRDEDIDIDTDDEAAQVEAGVRASGTGGAGTDDGTIEVADDEIETAEPSVLRHTQSSPTQPSPTSAEASAQASRSRPPARPSLRPRAPQGSTGPLSSALPPPRHLSSAPPSFGGSGSAQRGVDRWLLANKTLELSHAHAHITELEELLAFREARILELEEQLARANRKLEERDRPSAVTPEAVVPPVEHPVVTETRPAFTAAAGVVDDDTDDVDDELSLGDERESDYGATPLESVAVSGSEEDLQQINGIGPRFEAALRKQGITRLSQIAAWSDADVRQVAKALKIPKSRIVKGRWVEVAREVIGTRAASE